MAPQPDPPGYPQAPMQPNNVPLPQQSVSKQIMSLIFGILSYSAPTNLFLNGGRKS